MIRSFLFFGWVALMIAPLGCAPDAGRPNLVAASSTTTTTTSAPPRAVGLLPSSAPSRDLSEPSPTAFQTIVATGIVEQVEVFDEPDGQAIEQLESPTVSGGPLVFVVDEAGSDWHQVRLPVGAGDRRGWVRAGDVDLAAHEYRIEVDREALVLRVFDRTAPVFEAVVAIDERSVPGSGERVYVTELLTAPEPNPIYGTYAYGLSGSGDTFETFAGDVGQFGIHGTSDPESLGTLTGPGSVRMSNEDIAELVAFLPLGVVVDFVADAASSSEP